METRYTALEWAAMEGGHELPVTIMPKFSMLQELTEARMYRGADTLKGKTAEELARIVYLMILMLEILRHDDNSFAKGYVQNTIAYENFDAMRNNASDLHNLLAVLNNQSKFSGKILINSQIAVPVLQLKKYLRDIVNGQKEAGHDRQFLMKLEGFLKITSSQLKNIRRSVGDWQSNSLHEKAAVRSEIKNILNNISQQNDLFIHFKK